ncbi:hypothetical protein I3J09_16275 [Streptomyces clavuligerus]|nr:hypothetical protein [Streptomyces clavuligerus]AXU16594.1 hypothetical protein D1794_16745 [Streptomyces clavuligerus]MBY6304233.1 hypothetical protein [Streptomyces clavuligerus]QCS09357.1 hypothetical protein CRV15_16100 [Streptomyces clavuligerus]QPJ96700.1 hypothetical protein GE265_11935 [Streptomyces clavuligerus]QPL66618.1 hypothetical protein I3J04_16260 [Streptomyces clavuligerus]
MSQPLTVAQLVHQLQTLNPTLPVFLAVNPDWPFAHTIGRVIEGTGMDGPAVYIAEDGQDHYLPRDVAAELNWTGE